HRMASKTIKLVDASGNPVTDKPFELQLTNHKFLFGCGAFDAVEVANRSVSENRLAFQEEKMDLYLQVFNAGTLPFYWGRFEPEQGKPLTKELQAAARWLRDRN